LNRRPFKTWTTLFVKRYKNERNRVVCPRQTFVLAVRPEIFNLRAFRRSTMSLPRRLQNATESVVARERTMVSGPTNVVGLNGKGGRSPPATDAYLACFNETYARPR
jgi:hypothetical protein